MTPWSDAGGLLTLKSRSAAFCGALRVTDTLLAAFRGSWAGPTPPRQAV